MLLGCLEDIQKLLKTCLFFYFFQVRRRLFLDIFARIWYNIIRSTVRSNRSTKWLLILQILFADDVEFLYFKGFQRFGDILGDIQGPKGRGFKSRRLNQKYSTPLVCCIFLLFRRCDGACGTSCPLNKALIMPCRDEKSKRI